MNHDSTGLGNLVRQPHYIPSDSRLARHAAPLYRSVIFGLTTLIFLITLFKYRDAPPPVKGGFLLCMLLYTIIFIARMRMNKAQSRHFYRKSIQFARGQISIVSVSAMICLMAWYGYYDHMLWLLYVLATLLISEHNSTLAALITVLEVAALYLVASYLGWGFYTTNWGELGTFWQENSSLGVHILGIWLVTVIFHYLVRNIHGRDKALRQHQDWLNNITQNWVLAGKPQAQRQALIDDVEKFTGGKVRLWQSRYHKFVNMEGEFASQNLIKLANQKSPLILMQRSRNKKTGECCKFIDALPISPDASAQIIIPIPQAEEPHDLMGILDICYRGKPPGEYQIEMACENIANLTKHIQLVLLNSLKNEQLNLEWSLSFKLHRLESLPALAQQVVDDVVDAFGFDFATVSLVDDDENIIRCIVGRGADWVQAAIHPIEGDDVQSRTVRHNRIHLNDGKYKPHLDGRIWHQFRHGQLSRVWVPIPDPSDNPPYPALGTIEAGFHHENRKIVPPDLVRQLDLYANHVGTAFNNAERHQRTCGLANELTMLQDISREMQQASAFYEPREMLNLIGESAERLLNAHIVMLYTFDESKEQPLELLYRTKQAITGSGALCVSMKNPLLNQIYTSRSSYYASHARQDALLVNLEENGRLSHKNRTFTQRQNIKSVAGIPLIGKRGNMLGFLCINYRRRREFYPELRQIIELFAEQASVALEETYSHRLGRRMAIMQERNNLRTELHHTLSQELFGIKQYADTASIYATRNELNKSNEYLAKLRRCASSSLQSLQEMLNYLHQFKNGDIDFVLQLTDYIELIGTLYDDVDIQLEHQIDKSVPNQVDFYMLRIAREAINNALRHGKCDTIKAHYVASEEGVIHLAVQDNGIGFNASKVQKGNRNGLSTMKYYASQINTKVEINSQEGRGTNIQVCVSPPTKGV